MIRLSIFKINKKEILLNILIIVFIILLKASVFGNYSIPTGSMNPTITEGDKILSNNIAYSIRIPLTKYHLARWSLPQRGDVIAFIYPEDNKTNFTKNWNLCRCCKIVGKRRSI